jgi:hypothetical protein
MARQVALAQDRTDHNAIGSQPAIRSGTKEPAMTNRTATTAAIILSLAAASAPAASARLADYVPAEKQEPAMVYSRPDKSMIPVTTPSGDAIGRASALRSLTPQERHRVAAISALSDKQIAGGFGVAPPVANNASASHVVVRVHAPQRGFDWGDASIGAAGGLALAMLGVGGGLAIYHRPQRGRRTTAQPS